MSEEEQVPNTEGTRDLREELTQALVADFSSKINVTASIPNAASEAVIAALSGDIPSAEDILAALSLEDPIEIEVSSD